MNDVFSTQLAFGFIKLAAAGNAAKNTASASDLTAEIGAAALKTRALPAIPKAPTPKPTTRLAEGQHPVDAKEYLNPNKDKGKPTWDPVKAVK